MLNNDEMRSAEEGYIHPLQVVDKLPTKRKIFIKNSFLQLGYQLGIQERKIIKTIFKMISPEDDDFKTYRIKVKDFMDVTGMDEKSVYKMVKETLESLWNLRIQAIQYDNRGNQGETEMQWLITKTYWPKLGLVDVSLHPQLKSYLLGIKKMKKGEGGFSVILPEELEGATCKHTERLYELIKAEWKNSESEKKFDVTLEYLRFYMGFDKQPGVMEEDAKYKLPADFKKRVLDDAIKEINSDHIFTLFKVKCEAQKVGKKITYFTFTVTPRSQEDLQKFNMGNIPYDPETDLESDDIELTYETGNDVFVMLKIDEEILKSFRDRLLKFDTSISEIQMWANKYRRQTKSDEIFFNLNNPLYLDTVLNEIERIPEEDIRKSKKAILWAALKEGWGIPKNEAESEQLAVRQQLEAERELRRAQEEAAATFVQQEQESRNNTINEFLQKSSPEEIQKLAKKCQQYLVTKNEFIATKFHPDQIETMPASKMMFRDYIADVVLGMADN